MKLYYAPGTCSVACWISLEWSGADYEVEKVKMGSPEYKKINPLGAVPAVDLGNGEIRTEVLAILKYIVDKYPEKDLGADEGLENEIQFNEILSFMTGDFHPAFKPMFVPRIFTTSTDETEQDKVKEAAYAQIDEVMQHLDSIIGDDDHVYKNKKTVADAYVYILAGWSSMTPKSWKEYPNVKRFMENMEKDPVVTEIFKKSQE